MGCIEECRRLSDEAIRDLCNDSLVCSGAKGASPKVRNCISLILREMDARITPKIIEQYGKGEKHYV